MQQGACTRHCSDINRLQGTARLRRYILEKLQLPGHAITDSGIDMPCTSHEPLTWGTNGNLYVSDWHMRCRCGSNDGMGRV